MKFYQLTTDYATLLNEANVLNVSEPFDEHSSIKSYLADYASHITSPQLKKMFIKKLTKLLLNDESYHFAVRELPPNAPDWAQTALDAHELVKFVPNSDLNDRIQHISHYVIAMDNDTKNPENNIKTLAEREISGFNKTESIELMVKKSQAYFKRGGKSQKSDEGMKEIMDLGNGFRWLLLQTPEAYRLAGKVLQNCIGSYWSYEKSKTQNASIIVLKKNNGELAIAARIDNRSNTVDEMKGKNNKPPIDKYMPPVLQFLNQHPKLTLSSSAARDFSNAGYFSIQGKLYNRKDAIDKFVVPQKIYTFDDGRVVTILDTKAFDSQELLVDIYKTSGLDNLGNYGTDLPAYICEMVGAGKHYFANVSSKRELVDLSVQSQQSGVTEADMRHDNMAKEFIKVLKQHNVISVVSGKLGKKLLWDHNSMVTDEGDLVDLKPSEQHSHDDNNHTWDVHSDSTTKRTLLSNMRDNIGHNDTKSRRNSMDHIDPDDVDHVYTSNSTRTPFNSDRDAVPSKLVIPHTKDGKLHPVSITNSMLDNKYLGHNIKRTTYTNTSDSDDLIDRQKIQAIINIANTRKGTLPDNFTYQYGIIKNDDGKYEVYNAKMSKVSDTHDKIDLSSMKVKDRLNALSSISRDTNVRKKAHQWHDEKEHESYQHPNDMGAVGLEDYATDTDFGEKPLNRFMKKSKSQQGVSNIDWKKTPEEVSKFAYNGVPDAVHKIQVTYGANDQKLDVLVATDGNKIIKIDDHTGGHNLQSWGDHEKVVSQLNDFATKHKLSFDNKAVINTNELIVVKGELKTLAQKQTDQLKRMNDTGKTGRESVEELPFRDGHTLMRMSSEEQTKWLRKDVKLKTAGGQAWKLKNGAGTDVAIVTVKDDNVQNIYTAHPEEKHWKRDQHGDKLVNKAKAHIADGYVTGAARALGWQIHNTKQFNIKPESPIHNTIKRVYTNPDKFRYSPSANEKEAVQKGLISRVVARGSRIKYALTGSGRRALQNLNNNMNYNVRQSTEGRPIQADFKVPERAPRPVAPPRVPSSNTSGGTAQPRTGSKRAQALELYQQQSTDNGVLPTRGEFIQSLMAEPFSMSKAGASTYYDHTRKKYASMNEEFSHIAAYEIMIENKAKSFSQFLMKEYVV